MLCYDICSLTLGSKGQYLEAAQSYENLVPLCGPVDYRARGDLYLQAALIRLQGASKTMNPSPAGITINQQSMFSNALQDYDAAFNEYIKYIQAHQKDTIFRTRAKAVLTQFLTQLQTFLQAEMGTLQSIGGMGFVNNMTWWVPLQFTNTATFNMQTEYSNFMKNKVYPSNYFGTREVFVFHPLDFMNQQDVTNLIAMQPYSIGQQILGETPQGWLTASYGQYQNFDTDILINTFKSSSIQDPFPTSGPAIPGLSPTLYNGFKECLIYADINLMDAYAQTNYIITIGSQYFPQDIVFALQRGRQARTNALTYYDDAILKVLTALTSTTPITAASFTKFSACPAQTVLPRIQAILKQIILTVKDYMSFELTIFDKI